jgi:hypothetical protein
MSLSFGGLGLLTARQIAGVTGIVSQRAVISKWHSLLSTPESATSSHPVTRHAVTPLFARSHAGTPYEINHPCSDARRPHTTLVGG